MVTASSDSRVVVNSTFGSTITAKDHRYGCNATGPRRAASIHGMNCAMNTPVAISRYITMHATTAEPMRPKRYWWRLTGLENTSSAVPSSKSRNRALLTNSADTNKPSRVNDVRNLATTVGALRYTLPMLPPICTASLEATPKPSRAKKQANSQNSGERSCSRSSKRKNAVIMCMLRQAARACRRRRWK